MAKYTFRAQIILYGNYTIDIGDQDPDEYAEELQDTLTVDDIQVMDDETEITDWNKVDEQTT